MVMFCTARDPPEAVMIPVLVKVVALVNPDIEPVPMMLLAITRLVLAWFIVMPAIDAFMSMVPPPVIEPTGE